MTGTTVFPSTAAMPHRQTVLSAQGIPDGAAVPERVAELVSNAFSIYSRLVDPAGVRDEVTADEFLVIYRGEGRNAERTPLDQIIPEAEHLALFAVTIGEAVCAEIVRLFHGGDPALGYALDTIASAGAETLADAMARDYLERLTHSGAAGRNTRVLPYSPGYCGWHVSGQRTLFAALHPERIGVSLNSSFLMQPLKSVSGVLVAADRETHDFDIDFDFCADCADQACRQRIQSILFDTPGGQ